MKKNTVGMIPEITRNAKGVEISYYEAELFRLEAEVKKTKEVLKKLRGF